MSFRCFDFRWADENLQRLQLVNADAQFGQKKLIPGEKISLEITGGRRCVGCVKDAKWQPCENHVSMVYRCRDCKQKDGSFIYTVFDGFNQESLKPEELQKLQEEHVVYLALFHQSLVKVGVSKFSRKFLRQLEQGSDFALYIAKTPNGINARQIETLIRYQGMVDKIRASQKKDLIVPVATTEEAASTLRGHWEKLKAAAFVEHESLCEFLDPNPGFEPIIDRYSLEKKYFDQQIHFVDLEEGDSISGIIVGIKGPFIMIDMEGEVAALSLKDIVGYLINFEEKPIGLRSKKSLQGALF